MKRCIIFGALPVTSLPFSVCSDDFIIACDKGILWTEKLNIKPDLIIGDFDSLGTIPAGDNVLRLPVMKDDTDTGFAIKTAIEKGFREILVLGCVGGKLDHSFANISLSGYCAQRGVRAIFFGEDMRFCAVKDGSITLPPAKSRFSLFALSECSGVCINGGLYPLKNTELSPMFPLGVSNSQTGENLNVSVENGTAVLMWYADTMPID